LLIINPETKKTNSSPTSSVLQNPEIINFINKTHESKIRNETSICFQIANTNRNPNPNPSHLRFKQTVFTETKSNRKNEIKNRKEEIRRRRGSKPKHQG
jgi:hypothetical protein